MALQTVALNAAVDGLVSSISHVSGHTADPGGSGTNEKSGGGYARQAVTFAAASGGSRSANATLSFSGTASSAFTHAGLWTALSGGTFYGGEALTGDQAMNAAGEYDITTLTVTVSAA